MNKLAQWHNSVCASALVAVLALVDLAWTNSSERRQVPTGMMCELMARPEVTEIGDLTPEFGWVVGLGSVRQ